MMSQPGFFDFEERLAKLSKAGDPLEGLAESVDFEIFRKPLNKTLKYSDRRKGGRLPFDPVMTFKILLLQALYSLSDEQAEFMIRDRLSFMRFLGLGGGGTRLPMPAQSGCSAKVSRKRRRLISCLTGSTTIIP